MPDRAFQTVAPGAQVAKIEIQGRMREARLQGMFQLLGGQAILFFGLGINGLTQM